MIAAPLIIWRGDTFTRSLYPYVGNIQTRLESWFTVKTDHEDTDAEAMIQIQESTGLEVINGAVAGTPANGVINVLDPVVGKVQITLAAVEVAKLTSSTGKWFYDYQVLDGLTGDVTTLIGGELKLVKDVTKAIT